MTTHSRLRAVAVATLAASALALGLAAPTTAAPTVRAHEAAAHRAAAVGPTTFTERGRYRVGERTLALPSGAPVEVWYPTTKRAVRGKAIGKFDMVTWLPDYLKEKLPPGTKVLYPSGGVRGVEVADGRFPLVVFSHGFAGFRDQSVFLTSWLASWGFVVAAPDHHSRDLTKVLNPGAPPAATTDVEDLQATITLLGTTSKTKHSWLRGHVDMKHVGAVGHSAGGRAVENLALVDKRVDTFIGMAGASLGALDQEAVEAPTQPGLLITGSADGIVTLDRMRAAYEDMNAPKRFVLLDGAGHLVFSDLCMIGGDQGGLLSIAALLDIAIPPQLEPLATDGCSAPAMPVTDGWPAIRQVVIAQLRSALGIDGSAAGLTGLVEAFPGIVSESTSAP